jgi:signal transduction histidine kinase
MIDINETVQQNYDYLKRISTKVEFTLRKTYEPVLVPHSRILMSWVIENLVKNAVDAMKGEGKLELSLYKKNKSVYIDVTDTGSGMTKQQIKCLQTRIFYQKTWLGIRTFFDKKSSFRISPRRCPNCKF